MGNHVDVINYDTQQMKIRVKLYAGLRKYRPKDIRPGEVKQSFREGLTVSGLLKAMEIPGEEVMLILVNSEDIMGKGNETGDELHDGDMVELFPPMLGG